MKRLTFICHKDHLVSGSTNFLMKLFKREFDVDTILYDNGIEYIDTFIKIHPDAVYVLWQTEYLAPWLIAKGLKTVVFPMYDGCANAPDSYFTILGESYLFNFSKALHIRCVKSGVVSYPLCYYPQEKKIRRPIEKQNRLFYWLRKPDSPLSEKNILEYFSPYVEGFHIHDRPDDYKISNSVSRIADDFTTTSNWFEDKSQLISLIFSSRYYLAPRESEGIGMSFLEAMSMGCIVFANNDSTHDQYIYHGHNGFLVDFETNDKKLIHKQIKKSFEIIDSGKPIGENARQFILNGKPTWEEQSEKVLRLLVSLYHSKPNKPWTRLEQAVGYFLAVIYYKDPDLYFHLTRIAVKIGCFSALNSPKKSILRLILDLLKRIRGK